MSIKRLRWKVQYMIRFRHGSIYRVGLIGDGELEGGERNGEVISDELSIKR